MANSPQAIKRARQLVKRQLRNASQRSMMRTLIKKTLKLAASGNKEAAQGHFRLAAQTIDKMAGKGLIHQNKAARLKQRINKKLQA